MPSRDENIAYLTEKNLLTKAPETYKSDYLNRLAGQFKKIDAGGAIDWDNPKSVKYARDVARGKGLAPTIPLDKEGHRLKQVYMPNPQMGRDVANLLKKAPKRKRYLVVITGFVDDGSPLDMTFSQDKEVSYSVHVSKKKLDNWTADNPYGSLTSLAGRLFPNITWLSVSSVSLAYPKEK